MVAKVWASSLTFVAWVRVDLNHDCPCGNCMVSASAVMAACIAVIPLSASGSLRVVSTLFVSASCCTANLVICWDKVVMASARSGGGGGVDSGGVGGLRGLYYVLDLVGEGVDYGVISVGCEVR